MNNLMLRDDALKDKVIVVTGGGTGLGRSMSEMLSQLRASVVITSRKKDVLEKTANEISSVTGNKVLPVVCDVRKYDDVEHMLLQTINEFGKVTTLLNNAAGNFISPTERLSAKAFDTVVDIVLKGSYNCSLAFGKYWIENKCAGNMLNIVTTYSFTGSGFVVPSACAKAGVLALTRSLAAEWAKFNIRSNAIAPGPFPTEGAWTRLFPEPLQKIIDPIQRLPMKRVGNHEELANLASYLISDFSGYINGEVVVIDGGEWLYNAGQFTHFDKIPKEAWDMWEQMRKEKS